MDTPNESLINKICAHVKLGVNPDIAATAEGVPRATLADWIREADADPHGTCAEFVMRINQARAQGEILHLQRIVTDGGPRESQWILERMYPDKWAQKPVTPQKQQTASVLDAAFKQKRIGHDRKK